MSAAGGCRLNPGHHGPVLGGREVPSDIYPQHGSIQLEKLPLGTDSLAWTRGDGVSRPSEDASRNKAPVVSATVELVDRVSIQVLVLQTSLV